MKPMEQLNNRYIAGKRLKIPLYRHLVCYRTTAIKGDIGQNVFDNFDI